MWLLHVVHLRLHMYMGTEQCEVWLLYVVFFRPLRMHTVLYV